MSNDLSIIHILSAHTHAHEYDRDDDAERDAGGEPLLYDVLWKKIAERILGYFFADCSLRGILNKCI